MRKPLIDAKQRDQAIETCLSSASEALSLLTESLDQDPIFQTYDKKRRDAIADHVSWVKSGGNIEEAITAAYDDGALDGWAERDERGFEEEGKD